MDIDLQALLPLVGAMLVAGAVAGTMAGLLGVGGGLIMVPALMALFALLDVEQAIRMQLAVGTSLSTIVATSLSSVRSHNRRGAVDWRLLGVWAPSVVAGVAIGTWIAGSVHGDVLTIIFVIIALAAAAHMIFTPADLRLADRLPGLWVLTPIGVVIGVVSSLMGIGGAIVSVPTMVLCNYPVRKAVGTASGVGFVIAFFGTAGFIISGWGSPGLPPLSLGFVSVIGLVILMPMTVLFAPLGARIAHSIEPRWLKRLFAIFLVVSSAKMIYDLMA